MPTKIDGGFPGAQSKSGYIRTLSKAFFDLKASKMTNKICIRRNTLKRLCYLLFLAVTIIAGPVKAIQDAAGIAAVKEAIELIRDGNIQRGTLAMQELAGQGNPQVLFHIGEIHQLGIGKEESSVPVATMYYRLAAHMGRITPPPQRNAKIIAITLDIIQLDLILL